MKKNRIWKMLAAAGSFVILTEAQPTLCVFGAGPATKIEDTQYIVSGKEECQRLLLELVSSVSDSERHEFYVTGEDYEPETLVIARLFPETINISNTKMSERRENGKRYIKNRIGFERSNRQSIQEDENGVTAGSWKEGDIQIRRIGKKDYRFRCVDDDYRNPRSENQLCALFLCEDIIRSDVDSNELETMIVTFGETNNYRTSDVRAWLLEQYAGSAADEAEDPIKIAVVDTGVNAAFLGKTAEGRYGENVETELLKKELPIQTISDRLFLPSLEEILNYGDNGNLKSTIWNVRDHKESPYNRGFWLRTPVFEPDENGNFRYGEQVYAVDLEKKCITPVKTDDPTIGIRPAYCLVQE